MRNFSRVERIIAALYFVWFFIHFLLFFNAVEEPDNSLFWPFTSDGHAVADVYDVSEFLTYVGVPLLLFIVYKLIYGREQADPEHHHRQYGSFFIAFLDEKIKAEELQQKLNELQQQPVNTSYLNELKSDKQIATAQGISGWLKRTEVKKKYRGFEK